MMEYIVDALLDSLKLIPFLIVVYIVIGYLERLDNRELYKKLTHVKWIGPILGALIGCIPQCGFSVVGANLYNKRMIGLSTLIAIFVSTSDEAVPILLSHPNQISMVLIVLAIKVLIAIVAGLLIELIMGIGGKMVLADGNEAIDFVVQDEEGCTCGHHHAHEKNSLMLEALKHTFKVFIYILMVNILLNGVIGMIGEDNLGKVLLTNSIWQPAIAALIGLIPNCAASIVLTQMYVSGVISLGALIAGLCTGAGVGLVVLFKEKEHFWENVKIVLLLYGIGVLSGFILQVLF